MVHISEILEPLAQAAQTFHLDPTPENLTAWCDLAEAE